MWLLDPKTMCRKHLLGEHVELHMLAGCLNKGKNIKGFLEKGLVDPTLLLTRHDELAKEMKSRGYNHCSPISKLTEILPKGHVNPEQNKTELSKRCPQCRDMISKVN